MRDRLVDAFLIAVALGLGLWVFVNWTFSPVNQRLRELMAA